MIVATKYLSQVNTISCILYCNKLLHGYVNLVLCDFCLTFVPLFTGHVYKLVHHQWNNFWSKETRLTYHNNGKTGQPLTNISTNIYTCFKEHHPERSSYRKSNNHQKDEEIYLFCVLKFILFDVTSLDG